MVKLTPDEIQKKSDSIHNSEYTIKGEYVNHGTPILIRHKVCGYEWKVRLGNHFGGKKCPQCAGNAKLTKEIFQAKSNEVHNNEYLVIGEYESVDEQIKLRHLVCGNEFSTRGNLHLYNKTGCPECNGGVKLTMTDAQSKLDNVYDGEYKLVEYGGYDNDSKFLHTLCNKEFTNTYSNILREKTKCDCLLVYTKWNKDNFIEKSNEIHNSEYKLLSEFKNLDTKVLLEHKTCGYQWESLPKKHIHHKQGCPNCNESIGEKDIKRCLNEANIEYTIQKKFDDCRNIHPLPFDFYLPDYNVCIEFDGIQHFEASEWFGGQEALDKNIMRDDIKNKYCEQNKIKLYRISYLDNMTDKLDLILQDLSKFHTKQL